MARRAAADHRGKTGIVASLLLTALPSCTAVPPASGADNGTDKQPGERFADNVCFRCALRSCSIPANACTQEMACTRWLDCVSSCPTDASGVAAEGDCLLPCGLPVSAEVLFGCIQDFSSGVLLGCEQPCTPL